MPMENQSFTFLLTAYDIPRYQPQVARALERRSELLAQLKYRSKKQRGTMPQSKGGFHRRSQRLTVAMSCVALALAALCLVVFARNSAETLMLAFGAVLAAAGVFGLIYSRRDHYSRDAEKLLRGKDQFLAEDGIKIVFSELGMRSARSFIPYKEFQCWIETEDLFIFMYGPLVTMLQKTDLIDGELTDFRRLILDNIKLHAKLLDKPAGGR